MGKLVETVNSEQWSVSYALSNEGLAMGDFFWMGQRIEVSQVIKTRTEALVSSGQSLGHPSGSIGGIVNKSSKLASAARR